MSEKITKINDELEGSPFQKQQQFILFSLLESEALRIAMEASGFSKSRTIGIACRLLLEEVEKTKSEKKDDGAE